MPNSSAELIAFAKHLGCTQSKGTGKRGSHRTWVRPRPEGGGSFAAPIAMNKREIPDGTVASILRQLGATRPELDAFLASISKRPRKGR